jgi:hypothetical protein
MEDLSFLEPRENLIFLGAVGTGKTHLATAIALKACRQGRHVRFFTAASLANILLEKNSRGTLNNFLVALKKVVFSFAKASIDSLAGAIPLGQFSPWCPAFGKPEYPIHHTEVIIICRTATFPKLRMFWRQHILYSFPFLICDFISAHTHTISLHKYIELCNFYFQNKA